MTHTLTDDQLRRLRARAQRLGAAHTVAGENVAEVARVVVGLQAQDAAAASLSIRARSSGFTAADVERARLTERAVVRTWLMRGTLHLAATDDVGWLLGLLGPIYARHGRRRRLQLGLDDETSASGVNVIRDTLAAKGPLTREEIAAELAARGIQVEGQAAYHITYFAALQGIVCFGPDRDGKPCFVLLDDWIERAPALPREEALRRLADRYVEAYGPASPEDFASWSGLSMTDVRAAWIGIVDQLTELQTTGGAVWMLKARDEWLSTRPASRPSVRLVPAYDTYLLGYRSREFTVQREHARRVHPGGGQIRPTLLVDGQALGTWSMKRRRAAVAVLVEPFEALTDELLPHLEAEAADIGRFLGLAATLQIQPPASS